MALFDHKGSEGLCLKRERPDQGQAPGMQSRSLLLLLLLLLPSFSVILTRGEARPEVKGWGDA